MQRPLRGWWCQRGASSFDRCWRSLQSLPSRAESCTVHRPAQRRRVVICRVERSSTLFEWVPKFFWWPVSHVLDNSEYIYIWQTYLNTESFILSNRARLTFNMKSMPSYMDSTSILTDCICDKAKRHLLARTIHYYIQEYHYLSMHSRTKVSICSWYASWWKCLFV